MKTIQLRLPSRLTVQDLFFPHPWNLSGVFWNRLLDPEGFKEFVERRYIPFLKCANAFSDEKRQELLFVQEKLHRMKSSIDITARSDILPQDIYFAYLLITRVISYQNDLNAGSGVSISLLKGLRFDHDPTRPISEILESIQETYFMGNAALEELLLPCVSNDLIKQDSLYVLKMFWPEEIISAMYLGRYLKRKAPGAKVLLDVSEANEQFDYSSWESFIRDQRVVLSGSFDHFVLYKDFGRSVEELAANGGARNSEYSNLITIEGGAFTRFEQKIASNTDSISNFIKKTFDDARMSEMFGMPYASGRMFPYKCYWSRCHFCTINSQNMVVYDPAFPYESFIMLWVDRIRKSGLRTVVFIDEAIAPHHILTFARLIIKEGLDIRYQFRTRFDRAYSPENCRILSESGARFCGIGLESASQRVNEEIANKGIGHLSLKEKSKILHNFDSAGIPVHNYSIMGFPTETKKETVFNYAFLLSSIKDSSHFTVSPNIFALMKGSYIFSHLNEFGICVDDWSESNPLNLNLSFRNADGAPRDIDFYHKIAENIHVEQLLPWLRDHLNINATSFWDFIDRSIFFYNMKMVNGENPFRKYEKVNDDLLEESFPSWLGYRFRLSESLQIFPVIAGTFDAYDWVNDVRLGFDVRFLPFFTSFSSEYDLRTLLELSGVERGCAESFISGLLKVRILVRCP